MKQFLIALAVLVSATCLAQTENLPVDTVNGQRVYRYEVQKAEGLYRISKNFGVSQEELVHLNPALQTDGLRLGQTIFIPVVEKIDSTQYEVHTLQPKETLYGLSKQYGVTIDELKQLNPETVSRMAIGSKLLIRKKDLQKDEPAVVPEKKPVVAAEKKVDVQKKDLEERIKAEKEHAKAEEEHVTDVEPTAEVPTEMLEVLPETPEISALPIRLAYMLPFMTDAAKRDASIDRFIDFYEGALLAIYEAQESGQKFDIYTYDVQKSDVAVQQFLQRGELHNVDAIIGPAYPAQVNYTALYAKQNRIPMLVPFTSRISGVEHNPYVMQFNPSAEFEAYALVNYLLPKKDSVRFVLIDAPKADMPASVSALHKAVREAGFDVAETTVSRILEDSIATVLADDKENILVFPSEKYSAVQVLMPKVLAHKEGRQLTLFGHYAWEAEESLIPMIYPTVFHECNAAQLGHFETLYRHYFGHAISSKAPRYDLLGYDLTRALIKNIQHSQQALTEADRDAVYAAEQKGIQSVIAVPRAGEGSGRINTAIHIVRK